MADSITINGMTYRVEGSTLIAPTDLGHDGIETHIEGVTSTLSDECRVGFYRRGPRGGLSKVAVEGTDEDLILLEGLMYDARRHLRQVEAWRVRHDWGEQ